MPTKTSKLNKGSIFTYLSKNFHEDIEKTKFPKEVKCSDIISIQAKNI